MTLLLVSVKNGEEAKQAAESGADLIDLKDPQVGALGSLDDETSLSILNELQAYQHLRVSATVGDAHSELDELLNLVAQKAQLGVDFIKLPFSDYLFLDAYHAQITRLKADFGIEVIVVMNANESIPFDALPELKHAGFYGCMLDTFDKHNHLLNSVEEAQLIRFVKECKESNLFAGLAGSLRVSMVNSLLKLGPDYLGFRSGVCVENTRKNRLLPEAVIAIKGMLYNHNEMQGLQMPL